MKNSIRLEELAMLLLAILSLRMNNAAWWWYLLLLVGPDISMMGYVFGNKTGAVVYNLFHHKGIAIGIFIAGVYFNIQWMMYAGTILFGHSSLDRMLGYGLKYNKGFKFTHLGIIGKKNI